MDPIVRSVVMATQPRRLPRTAATTAAPAPIAPVAPVLAAAQPAPTMPEPAAPALPPAAVQELLDAARAEQARWLQEAEQAQRDWYARAQEEQLSWRARAQQDLSAAYAEAEARGFAAGGERAQAAAEELVREQVARLAGVANRVLHERAQLLAEAEDTAVEIAFAAVCRVLGEQAAAREGIAALVRRQLGAVRDGDALTVHLHPHDHDLLSATAAQSGGFGPRVRTVPDPAVELGGCMIDSQSGMLDARLEHQVGQLRAALVAARAVAQEDI